MAEKTGRQLLDEAVAYYRRNGDLMFAHIKASRVLSDCGVKTSARFLTEFARWMRMLGPDGMQRLLGCYEGVVVRGEEKAAIPNATSAYLTRLLYEANKGYPNFDIDVRHSKMFEGKSDWAIATTHSPSATSTATSSPTRAGLAATSDGSARGSA